MAHQKTLRRPINCTGVGLHSGEEINAKILPAEEDTGYVFKTLYSGAWQHIGLSAANVVDTRFATTIGNDVVRISTVEHMLAALNGLGVDNAIIEIDNIEAPIMDGSAAPFVKAINEAGLKRQSRPKKVMRILKPVEVTNGDKFAALYPSDKFTVDFSIDFAHPIIGRQSVNIHVTPSNFRREIAGARTFGFLSEINAMKGAGFARGGSLDNAIVVGEFSILNSGGLRFPDEFVRHKALDAVGDLAILGRNLQAAFVGRKAGHAMHYLLVKAVLEDESNYEIVESSMVEENLRTADSHSMDVATVF